MREKPTVGQTLYSLNVGNASRNRKQVLTPVVVIKVGRKYFTCSPEGGGKWQHDEFLIDTWTQKTNYSPDAQLYASREEYEEERERDRIVDYLVEVFRRRPAISLSLNQLREIERIVLFAE